MFLYYSVLGLGMEMGMQMGVDGCLFMCVFIYGVVKLWIGVGG